MPDPDPEVEEVPQVRSFWAGTISFGLVSIPVELFPAVRSREISLRLVDDQGHAVGREYYCPEDGETVGSDELVRGHADEDGRTLVVTDEELEAIAPEMSRDIDLRRFVPKEQIPAAYFERPYYMAPSGRSTKAYHLLARTMEQTGRVGIGTFVMRGHEYLVAILAEKGLLRAETLRWADELRSPETIGLPSRKKAPKARVGELEKAIGRLAGKELPREALADDRAERLHRLVEAKIARGEDIIVPAVPQDEEEEEGEGGEVLDLMQILQERIAGKAKEPARKKASGNGRHGNGRHRTAGELRSSSKQELYARATELHIEGRSKMTKSQLIAAIRRAG